MELRFDPCAERATGVVVCSGRLDLLTAGALREHVQMLVEQGWRQLVVDLGNVPFVDSSGLCALIAALKAARVAGGDCRIARPAEQIQHILQISNLDRVLISYPTVEEALAEYL